MNYEQFFLEIQEYYKLYQQGLKKQANVKITKTMESFDELAVEIQQKIMFTICKDVCDDKLTPEFQQTRGNGCLPYELEKRIRKFLLVACEKEFMPQLRWYYEMFRDVGPDVIAKAYHHPKCDDKTVRLYIRFCIGQLDWGAHHFPEGCIITKAYYNALVALGEKIIKEHEVALALVKDFYYFKELYQVWWSYTKMDTKQSFEELCKERKVNFSIIKAYYYSK